MHLSKEFDCLAPEDTEEDDIPKPSELVSMSLKNCSPTFALPDIQNAFKGSVSILCFFQQKAPFYILGL